MLNFNCITKVYATLPPVNEKETLRYAGVKGGEEESTHALFSECLHLGNTALSCRVCYARLPVETLYALMPSAESSKGLRDALGGAKETLVFAATLGLGIDRLLVRYGEISPSKALMLQAIGAERIEALCNEFCKDYAAKENLALGRRFSPGYGDFPLSAQRDIFRLLDCPRQIGLTLTESLIMSPSKSVTAIVGLGERACDEGCVVCKKEDCEYRK